MPPNVRRQVAQQSHVFKKRDSQNGYFGVLASDDAWERICPVIKVFIEVKGFSLINLKKASVKTFSLMASMFVLLGGTGLGCQSPAGFHGRRPTSTYLTFDLWDFLSRPTSGSRGRSWGLVHANNRLVVLSEWSVLTWRLDEPGWPPGGRPLPGRDWSRTASSPGDLWSSRRWGDDPSEDPQGHF